MLRTADGRNTGAFVISDWGLLLVPATIFGSSFLLMAIGLDALEPGVVSFGRVFFGFLALGLMPAARVAVPADAWPRLILLGFTWIALPLTLFPLAQQHISSSVAGMINGGTPLMVGLVASVLLRRLPGRRQMFGIALGVVGIFLISLPALGTLSSSDAGNDRVALGILMAIGAIAGYGVSFNVTVPLQQAYGALAVMWRVQAVGAVLMVPGLILGLPDSRFVTNSVVAVVALGVFGTGLAYAASAALAGRVGATRSSILTYFVTPIAMLLGVVFRNDVITTSQFIGAGLTLAGAWFASRAET